MSSNEQIKLRVIKRKWAAQCLDGQLFCFLCGKQIKSMKDCNADHWVPKALGGETTEENIKPAHPLCNSLKGCMSPEEFLAHKDEILSKKFSKTNQKSYKSPNENPTNKQVKKLQKSKKHKNKILYEISYKIEQPYKIGDRVFYIKELEEKNGKPRFTVKESVVIGYTRDNNIERVLVKDFYAEKDGKINSELIEVVPLTKTQAIATKIEYERIVKNLIAQQKQLIR